MSPHPGHDPITLMHIEYYCFIETVSNKTVAYNGARLTWHRNLKQKQFKKNKGRRVGSDHC